MAFKPSLREVLSPEVQEPARAALQADPSSGTTMPWFVRLLAGGGAWLAALFLVIFLALLVGMGKDAPVAIAVGLVLTGAAIALRRANHHVFLTQLALSVSLAGQGFFLYGMVVLTDKPEPTCLAVIVLQVAVFLLYPDQLQRFLSTIFASSCLLYLLFSALTVLVVDVALVGLAALAHALFLRQGTLQGRARGELVTPAAFGLVTLLLSLLLTHNWFHEYGIGEGSMLGDEWPVPVQVLSLGLAAVTLYSAVRVMRETGARPEGAAGVTVFAALVLTALLTARTPGIIAALGVLMLGFHRRSVVLLGMAVVFLFMFSTSYYYSLEITLLAKSLVLLGSGLLMLGLRLFVARRFPLTGAAS